MAIQEGLTALADVPIEPPSDVALTAAVMEQIGDLPPGDQDPLQDAVADPDHSGIRDLRELAALAGGQEAGDSMSDIFGLNNQDEAGPSMEVPAVVPPPVLMPVETNTRWLKPTLILGGVLLLGLVALAAVIFLKHGRQSRLERAGSGPAVASADKTATAPETAKPLGSMEAAGGAMETRPGSPAAPRATAPNDTEKSMGPETDNPGTSLARHSGAHQPARRMGGNRRQTRHRGSAAPSHTSASRPARKARDVPDFTVHARQPSGRPSAGSNDPLAALLSSKRNSRASARSEPSEHLPTHLNTSQIRRVMRRATGAMKRCYEHNKQSGILTVRVTVKGATGKISSLAVSGKFRGTATARCAIKALRRLTFPKFSSPTQKFSYPYLLR